MRIRLWSDLHLEFKPFVPTYSEDDKEVILVIAGDLCPYHFDDGVSFFSDVAKHYREVLYVPGNHEYYRERIGKVDNHFKELQKTIENFHYLNPNYVDIDGIRFVGACLWTDFNGRNPVDMFYARNGMSDYRLITDDSVGYRKFTPESAVLINAQHRHFFEHSLDGWNDKSVIISHHPPMQMNPNHISNNLDYAFHNTGMEPFLEKYKPTYWLHGHTHFRHTTKVCDTIIASNPRGYPTEFYWEPWDENFTVNISL